MIPYYMVGNLHCLGMCGPLVMMLSNHRYRSFYFLGRTTSFVLAAMASAEAGSLLSTFLQGYFISAAASLLLAALLFGSSLAAWYGRKAPGQWGFSQLTSSISQRLSMLMLRDKPLATFLFGFFTVVLPCGQTVVVFAACALTGELWSGFINGLAFALLTSPALFMALHAQNFFKYAKKHYLSFTSSAAFIAGTLACLRGIAELGFINHFALPLPWQALPHLVLY